MERCAAHACRCRCSPAIGGSSRRTSRSCEVVGILLAYPGEIRESQLENLVDRQLCKSSGADGVAGGEYVDEVAIKLGQGANPDPVRIPRYGL